MDELRNHNPFIPITRSEKKVLSAIAFSCASIVTLLSLTDFNFNKFIVLVSLLVYCLILCMPFLILKKNIGWFHPLIFTLLWFEIRNEIIFRTDIFIFGLNYHIALSNYSSDQLNDIVSYAFILKSIGLISLYFGYFISFKDIDIKIEDRKLKLSKLKLTLFFVIAIIGFIQILVAFGGIGNLLLYRGLPGEVRLAFTANTGYLQLLVASFLLISLIYYIVNPKALNDKVFLIYLVIGFLMTFAVTGSRAAIIVPLLGIAAVWALHNNRIPTRSLIILALISLLIVGSGAIFRYATRATRDISDVSLNAGITDALTTGLQDISDRGSERSGLYGILGRVPDQVPFLMGDSYVSFLVAPIPRTIWQDKPLSAGRLNSIYIFNRPYDAIPPTVTGEAFWNFGILGVIFIHFLWGVFIKLLYQIYRHNSNSAFAKSILIVSLLFFYPDTPSLIRWIQRLFLALIACFIFCGIPKFSRRVNQIAKEN